MNIENFLIPVSESIGNVSAEALEPTGMTAMMTLAHGAGANMNHQFMKSLAKALADHNIGSLRYNFPFMERGKGRPDPPAIAEKTVEAVINEAHKRYPGIPLLVAGKSFGGRMTSQYISKHNPVYVSGIVFYGFPLHAPGDPSVGRATHLSEIKLPMLFLQGTRDSLADPILIRQVASQLSSATVSFFEGADHSFKAGKKDLIPALAEHTAEWFKSLAKNSSSD
jgi:predicted alpha/beta-hydrolase family hydrolase